MNTLKKLLFYVKLFMSTDKNKSRIYSQYLGIKMGNNVRILHYPRWGSEPFLIEIGDNVTITRGVSFVNHDGGVALFRKEYPGLNVYGKIVIGNNVFIGINSIILPGVTIGNNVVVGAGSIVNKDVPDKCVIAGVPARQVKELDTYKKEALKKGIQINNVKDRKFQILDYINKSE